METQVTNVESMLREVHAMALINDDSNDAVRQLYDNWAGSYDTEYEKVGYNGPKICSEALSKVVPDKNAVIIDCASGTGQVGEQLARLGFKRIHAVDFSQKCLDISASKGVYEKLICDRLSKDAIKGVEEGYYDGLICVGAISLGHLKKDVFDEWTRIVKKGGVMVFALSWAMVEGDSQEHYDIMNEIQEAINGNIQRGIWELVEKVDIHLIFENGHADMYTIRRM